MAKLSTGFDQHIIEPAGLDLASDPLDSECLEALNVVFTDAGRVMQRSGYRILLDGITSGYGTIATFYSGGVTQVLYRYSGTQWRASRISDGVTVDTYSIAASDAPVISSFARVSTPTSSATYIATANTAYGIRKFDGATFTAPAGTGPSIPPDPNLAQISGYTDTGTSATTKMPAAPFVAVTPWGSNRLVAARVTRPTSEAGDSRVMFSAKGKPETWQINHYVDLNPGDGEWIQGMVAWRDKLFVFKRTSFYVFYGEHSDENGNPVFDYTSFTNRSPMRRFSNDVEAAQKVCAGNDGVYYVGQDGIYRTTGQDPVKISGPLEPIFTASRRIEESGDRAYFLDVGVATRPCRLAAHNGHIIFTHATGSTGDMNAYVYHEATRRWSRWVLGPTGTYKVTGLASVDDPDADDGVALLFSAYDIATGSDCIVGSMWTHGWDFKDGMASDGSGGSAYDVTYHTGLVDLGTPEEKVLREVIVEASRPNSTAGTLDITVGTDRDPSPATFEGLTYQSRGNTTLNTTYPQALRHRYSYKGRWFQTQITNLDAEINRLILGMGGVSGPSTDES